jgi:hypothetical protein
MNYQSLALAACAGLFMTMGLPAQEFSHFTFGIGAGFTTPVGDTGTRTDYGWNVRGGAGVKFNPYVGLMVDAGYDNLGINSSTLANIGVPGGRISVFSATLDPIVHLTPKRHFDLYVTGGGGIYHRFQEFTAPTVAVTTGFDPFFGFFPVALQANQVLASYSVNKPGIDFGMGIAFGSKWHGKFFAEARYNRIFMGNRFPDTEYLPVTFGFRF